MAMPLEHPHALNPFYIEEDDQDPDHPWEGPQMIMHGGQPYDVHAPFYTEGDEPDPDYPWEDKYRHEAVTLGTFIGMTQAMLLDAEVNTEDKSRLLCCLRVVEPDATYRLDSRKLRLNIAAENTLGPDEAISMTRDYDSAFGYTEHLPVEADLEITVTPMKGRNLTNNNHARITIPNPGGQGTIVVSAFEVPNMTLALFNKHSTVMVAFPKLYRAKNSVIGHLDRTIPDTLQKSFYNLVLRPAIQATVPDRASSFAVNAENVENDKHRRPIVGKQVARLFADQLHWMSENCTNDKFHDMRFFVVIRGVKDATWHPPEDADERDSQLRKLFENIDPRSLARDYWTVDVAVELARKDHVMQIRRSQHAGLLKLVVPAASDEQVQAVLRSKAYRVDYNGQLYDCAGFDVPTADRAGFDDDLHVKAYTTDKNFHDTFYKNNIYYNNSPKYLLPAHQAKLLTAIGRIKRSLYLAAGIPYRVNIEMSREVHENGATTPIRHDGAVRIEATVKYNRSSSILGNSEYDLVYEHILSIPTKWWWYVSDAARRVYAEI